jgi:peptidoglycan/LPS O-acetylase OafA/YrhL
MTQSTHFSHKPWLDGWRGLAILLVLVGHFFPSGIINFGRLGVELFFILSGHLMGQLLFIKQVPLTTFFKRRLSRIIPAMLVFIVSSIFIAPYFGIKVETLPLLLASTFTINYVHFLGLPSSHLYEHFWSLAIEEHSYIMLGFIAFITRAYGFSSLKIIGTMMVLMLANGYISTLIFHQSFYESYWRTDIGAFAIFLSVFLTILSFKLKRLPLWFMLGASLIVLYLARNSFPYYAVKYSLGTVLIAIILVNLDKAPTFVLKALSNKLLMWFGTISYSLYLWQQLFYVAIPQFNAPLMLASAIGAGTLSYYLIEKPMRVYLNSLGEDHVTV